ncbi:MAG: MoaD/ThiS family protein [Cyanobacteriota bacterium]|nr:MoaD/ThiS family protein [Cyanobacteriota bacterium]
MPSAGSLEAPVRVRLFAALREAAGWSERLVVLSPDGPGEPCTPLELWDRLDLPSIWSSAVPSGRPAGAEVGLAPTLPHGLRVAINQVFSSPTTPLKPGDELAFLPPITGG